jgi:uncharacterized OB-fold protein
VDRPHLPVPSALTQGFWDAARDHRLVVQRCDRCRCYRHYPQYLCPDCGSENWTWAPLSGRGAVVSYATAHQAFHPGWQPRIPYTVATVELDEGVRMVSDLTPEDASRVQVGAPVEVFFEDVNGGITLPRFRLLVDTSHEESTRS